MKRIFTFLLVLIVLKVPAQVVNIPDINFKNFLLNNTSINSNGDNEIQEAEALSVDKLSIGAQNITDLTGIRSFANLREFTCMFNTIPALDLSGLTKLFSVSVDENEIVTVNLAGCTAISYLTMTNNKITSIDVTSLSALQYLYLGYNPQLDTLKARNLFKLNTVSLYTNKNLTDVDLSGCYNLEITDFSETSIQKLNISGASKIDYLRNFGIIDTLVAQNCTGLKMIQTGFNTSGIYSSMDLTGCSNLETIYLQESTIQSLDLGTNYKLRTLIIFAPGQGLKYLNLRNGSSLDTLEIGNYVTNLNDLDICVDDFEVDEVKNAFFNYDAVVNVSTHCTFFPGGPYNTIKGNIKIDLDNNGCGVNDAGAATAMITITDNAGNTFIRSVTNTGAYAHYPPKGTFILTPSFPNPYFSVDPPSATVIFDTANSLTSINDFCVSPNGVHNDLEITLIPVWPPARPGFEAGYQLVYENKGSTTIPVDVQLDFDDSKLNFISASVIPTQQITGQLHWYVNELKPFEKRSIQLMFTLLAPPVNNVNDTLTWLAALNTNVVDETPENNSFTVLQPIRGSFDPNDKQCLQGTELDITSIGKYLNYLVRFQNTGNDTAFNVVVTDTLSNNLDWATVAVTDASHTYNLNNAEGKLEFVFEGIKLPAKTTNEPASNGFVAFKVRSKSSLVAGDIINNKAAIYFDFNEAVITNTFSSLFTSTSTPIPVRLEFFSLIKRSSSNKLNWKAPCASGTATFIVERSNDGVNFEKIGNIAATAARCLKPFSFLDEHPVAAKNYYRLKISAVDGRSFYSNVLLSENSVPPFAITGVNTYKGNTIFYFNASRSQTIQYKLIAADGRMIHSGSSSIGAGRSHLNLSLQNNAAGVYTLLVYTADGEVFSKRVVR